MLLCTLFHEVNKTCHRDFKKLTAAFVFSLHYNSQELLDYLFDPESMEREEKSSELRVEFPPKQQLGGLGSGGKSKGKYDGFGSSPVQKEGILAFF